MQVDADPCLKSGGWSSHDDESSCGLLSGQVPYNSIMPSKHCADKQQLFPRDVCSRIHFRVQLVGKRCPLALKIAACSNSFQSLHLSHASLIRPGVAQYSLVAA